MTRTDCIRELIIKFLGIEGCKDAVIRMNLLLDMFKEAIQLDLKKDEDMVQRVAEAFSTKPDPVPAVPAPEPQAPADTHTHTHGAARPETREPSGDDSGATREGLKNAPEPYSTECALAMGLPSADCRYECSDSNTDKRAEAIKATAREKNEIHAALVKFRKDKGLGSFNELIKASNGALTDEDIRNIYDRRRVPITKWRVLKHTLDYLKG